MMQGKIIRESNLRLYTASITSSPQFLQLLLQKEGFAQ